MGEGKELFMLNHSRDKYHRLIIKTKRHTNLPSATCEINNSGYPYAYITTENLSNMVVLENNQFRRFSKSRKNNIEKN